MSQRIIDCKYILTMVCFAIKPIGRFNTWTAVSPNDNSPTQKEKQTIIYLNIVPILRPKLQ